MAWYSIGLEEGLTLRVRVKDSGCCIPFWGVWLVAVKAGDKMVKMDKAPTLNKISRSTNTWIMKLNVQEKIYLEYNILPDRLVRRIRVQTRRYFIGHKDMM